MAGVLLKKMAMKNVILEGGYDFKLVKEDKNLECPICLLLLREAIGTQCRHLLCKVCLEKLQRSSADAGRDLRCPTCKEIINVNKVYENVYIDGVVTGSDVFCMQQDAGCNWVGTLAAYLREHHEKCEFAIISCENIGCEHKLPRNLMIEHASKCHHRHVNCEYCQMKMKFNEIEVHYTMCQRIPVSCTTGCGMLVPREKMKEHLNNVCGLIEVNCQFFHAGCNEKIKRMDVHRHNLEYTQVHMGFLCEKFHLSQRKIEQLENANIKSEQEIEELKMSNNQLKLANNRSLTEIEELKMSNNRSQTEIEELKISNNRFQTEIEELKISKNRSQTEIEKLKTSNNQLKVANHQSQNEIDELKRKITEIENQKLVRNQIEEEKPKNVASNVVVPKPYVTEQHMNPTASPYVPINNELISVLQKGVKKFLVKDFNKRKYEKWYDMIDQKMELNSVCENKDFLFMKLFIAISLFDFWKLNFMMKKVRPVTNKVVINLNDGWVVKKKDGSVATFTFYTDKYKLHNCRCFEINPFGIIEYKKENDCFSGGGLCGNVIICLKLL